MIVFAFGGFYGGSLYQKNKFVAELASQSGNLGFSDIQESSQRGLDRLENLGDLLVGQVTAKEENNVTIKIQDGGSRIVYFSDSTGIGKSVQGSAEDLQSGQQVTISGKANQDGTFAAQNIIIRPDAPTSNQSTSKPSQNITDKK